MYNLKKLLIKVSKFAKKSDNYSSGSKLFRYATHFGIGSLLRSSSNIQGGQIKLTSLKSI